jgi:proteasome lid subunit RPN8/RPN11
VSLLRIADEVLDAIRRHAAETYPNECCGALIGHAPSQDSTSIVITMTPLPNETEEGPRRRFLVRPDDYRRAEAKARASGAQLLGFYHSHPDHPARPSQYDLDHAWPNLSYVIVAVDHGTPGTVASWRLRADRAAFDEEGLEETRT